VQKLWIEDGSLTRYSAAYSSRNRPTFPSTYCLHHHSDLSPCRAISCISYLKAGTETFPKRSKLRIIIFLYYIHVISSNTVDNEQTKYHSNTSHSHAYYRKSLEGQLSEVKYAYRHHFTQFQLSVPDTHQISIRTLRFKRRNRFLMHRELTLWF
jgi:hypothetical protein